MHVGLLRRDLGEHPGDPDRLGTKVGSRPVVAGGGRVALVEDQVEHAHHVVEPLLALLPDRELERLALEGLLGARDALPDGRVLGQERAGDLGHGQAADQSERERRAALGRQRRVAGEEDQPQHVVVDVVDESVEVGHLHLLPFQGVAELRRTTAQGVGAPERVDAASLGGLHQPGRRVVGDAVARPLLQRGDERVLGEVLGEGEVAGHPGERADEPRRLRHATPVGRRHGGPGRSRSRSHEETRTSPRHLGRPASDALRRLVGLGDPPHLDRALPAWPVLQVQVGHRLALGAGLLLAVELDDRPAADDLLGLGVGAVGDGQVAAADAELDGVGGAVQTAAVDEGAVGDSRPDVLVPSRPSAPWAGRPWTRPSSRSTGNASVCPLGE